MPKNLRTTEEIEVVDAFEERFKLKVAEQGHSVKAVWSHGKLFLDLTDDYDLSISDGDQTVNVLAEFFPILLEWIAAYVKEDETLHEGWGVDGIVVSHEGIFIPTQS